MSYHTNNIMIRFIQTIVFLFLAVMAVGQLSTDGLHLSAVSHNGEIRLRWMASDYDVWRAGNEYGYIITRQVPGELNSRDTLYDNLSPLTPGMWSAVDADVELVNAAEQLIYDQSLEYQVTGDPTFLDAIESEQSNDNLLFFAMMVAEQDFELAQAMSLGTTYTPPTDDTEYLYGIIIKHPDEEELIFATTYATLTDEPIYPIPVDVVGEPSNNAIVISWPTDAIEASYSHYTLQRSLDGVSWENRNTAPFVPLFSEDAEQDIAIYSDTIENTLGTYYYRLYGTTPFSIDGPFSEVIQVQAQPTRYFINVSVDSILIQGKQTTLGWYGLDDGWSSKLKGFEVYRSLDYDGPFTKVNSSLISPSRRSFQLTATDRFSYYKVIAIDKFDREYPSYVELVSLPDRDNPAIPKDFDLSAQPVDEVTISWAANTESDLLGYRLFRSYIRDGVYDMVSEDALITTSFLDNLEGAVGSDSVFYKIEAYDLNSNSSGLSSIIGIERYDHTAPIAPFLYKAIATPQGVELGWQWSGSDDAVSHEVRRRKAGFPDWEVVAHIEPYNEYQYPIIDSSGVTPTMYIDEDDLDATFVYQYHIVAYDENGNSAGSDIISVRPFESQLETSPTQLTLTDDCVILSSKISLTGSNRDSVEWLINKFEEDKQMPFGRRKKVEELIIEEAYFGDLYTLEQLEAMSDATFASLLYIIRDRAGLNQDQLDCTIRLEWSYDMQPGILGFRIYRSMDGSSFVHYRTLGIDDFFGQSIPDSGLESFSYTDDDIVSRKKYIYKIMAEYEDGGLSDYSNPSIIVASN